MTASKNLRKSLARHRSQPTKRGRRCRPSLECLEDRTAPAIFTVNTINDTVDINPGNGLALDASGNTSLRAAIMESNALAGPDTIQLPAGNYLLTLAGVNENAAATGDLDITGQLTIVGVNRTTTIVNAQQLDRVFHVRSTTASISNVTITGGLAPSGGNSPTRDGGGILNEFGTLNLDNSIVSANRTGDGFFGGNGGGIYTFVANSTITNSIIANNTTGNGQEVGGSGGGAGALTSTVVIRNTVISGNRTGDGRSGANLATAGRGGGVWSTSGSTPPGSVTIIGSTISGNVVGTNTVGFGGGIDVTDNLVLETSSVLSNTAFHGGGIELDNGTAQRILNSTIADNTSTGGEGGGGIHSEVGVIELLAGTTISGNRALNTTGSFSGGGGIFSQGLIRTIINSTISGNSTSGVGGGIGNSNDIGAIINTTIANNTAADGGGLFHATFVSVPRFITELTNTIIGDNSAGTATGKDFRQLGVVTVARNNLIEDATGHSIVNGVNGNIVGLDPGLLALANNGGPTRTHALRFMTPAADSPAINTGFGGAGVPTTDQRGLQRPSGAGVDIGAFEVQIPANQPPVANNDSYNTSEDLPLTIAAPGVLVNDTDPNSDPLTAILVSGPSHGSLAFNANGSFTYTPAANYFGPDSFTYKANDGRLDSNIATVSISVNPLNDAPVANNDSFSTNEDTPLTAAAPGVLGNDTDVENDPLSAILVSNPSHGTVTLNSNGSFTYAPNSNFNGTDSFTYKANDDSLDSNTATVSITINAVNDAPVAVNDSYSTSQGVILNVPAIGVLANDTDVEGNPLTALLVGGPSNGTATLNANGSFSYVPNAGFNGTDSFSYKANDGLADSNVATGSIRVAPAPFTPGKITGGGSLDSGLRRFNINIQSREHHGQFIFRGDLDFDDREHGISLQSTAITSFHISPNGAVGVIAGSARVNGQGGYSFTAILEDHGEPGAGVDKFHIIISGPGGFQYDSIDFASAAGLLTSGNIQIHRR